MKKIHDEELEKLIDAVLQVLPTALSYLFGKRINGKFTVTSEEKKKYVSIMKEYLQSINQIKQMEKEKVNPKKITLLYLAKMDELQHLINPEIPENQHFVDYYINFFTNVVNEPSEISFIASTRYPQYMNLLKELMIKIISIKRGEKIKRFLEQINKSEDPIIFAQACFLRLINDYKFLDKKECE